MALWAQEALGRWMPSTLTVATQAVKYPLPRGTGLLKYSLIFSGVMSSRCFGKRVLISLFDILNSLWLDLLHQHCSLALRASDSMTQPVSLHLRHLHLSARGVLPMSDHSPKVR